MLALLVTSPNSRRNQLPFGATMNKSGFHTPRLGAGSVSVATIVPSAGAVTSNWRHRPVESQLGKHIGSSSRTVTSTVEPGVSAVGLIRAGPDPVAGIGPGTVMLGGGTAFSNFCLGAQRHVALGESKDEGANRT